MAYTNFNPAPRSAGEKWPLPLFGQLLPRLLEIILEINARFMARFQTLPGIPGE